MCDTRDKVESEYKEKGYVLVEATEEYTLLQDPKTKMYAKISQDGKEAFYEPLAED